jgi:competence ComEA-like helix-hairpin-helix protein
LAAFDCAVGGIIAGVECEHLEHRSHQSAVKLAILAKSCQHRPAKDRNRMPPSPQPPKSDPAWLLRRTDQVTVATLILSGLFSVIGWWIYHGGLRGKLVEIERAETHTAAFQVDINKADWPELATLPGVGRKLAERIVQSREQDGPYSDIDDLRRVRGIGPKTLETLRPYLRPLPRRRAVAGR